MNGALYQTVALEGAQRLGKHFLRNAPDLALQRGITHRSARQNLDNESRPLVGNSIENESGRTLRIQHGRGGRRFSHAPV